MKHFIYTLETPEEEIDALNEFLERDLERNYSYYSQVDHDISTVEKVLEKSQS